MTIYTTTGPEMIDDIAWRHYGYRRGTAEAVLTANPGLSTHGPLLPPGLSITLPDLPAITATQIPVKLYD
ncbi:MAG: tail protein X [Paracoccus sp. (in: a-proteobacteria)]|uniref:tail protein X n=1 Tax=Paracoccus sp. TaxID=267 RepID=UPI0026DFCC12|nr:tail protein X [Paracoccus sp. (in: a-proteobacteria)]MDO5631150.1 tail protein X [Paracoccus sp. (in: a-proteobacteria)]